MKRKYEISLAGFGTSEVEAFSALQEEIKEKETCLKSNGVEFKVTGKVVEYRFIENYGVIAYLDVVAYSNSHSHKQLRDLLTRY